MKIRSNSILWGNFYAFIIMGMLTLFFGSNMSNIRETYHLTYVQGGLVLSAFSIGSLVFGFLSGVIGDIVGMKRMVVSAHVLFIAGMIILTFSQSILTLYIGVFVIGAGAGACSTSINIIVNDFVQGDGKIMSLLHMFFGIGAFLIPMLSAGMINFGFHWKRILIFLTICEIICIIITLKMTIHTHISHPKGQKYVTKKAFMNKRFYIFMAILFFYVGAENTFNGWIVTYLIEGLKLPESFSNQMLSTFWAVMIGGRFMNSIISQKFHKESILWVSSIGAIIMMFLLTKVTAPFTVAVVIILMGLMFSGIYPLTVANANPIIKGSGSASAIFTSMGSLGAAIIPYMSGKAAGEKGITGILFTVLITLILLSLFTIINKRMQTDHDVPNQNEEVIM